MNKPVQRRRKATGPDLTDYPVREYVAAMATELAGLLESAADMARRTAPA